MSVCLGPLAAGDHSHSKAHKCNMLKHLSQYCGIAKCDTVDGDETDVLPTLRNINYFQVLLLV